MHETAWISGTEKFVPEMTTKLGNCSLPNISPKLPNVLLDEWPKVPLPNGQMYHWNYSHGYIRQKMFYAVYRYFSAAYFSVNFMLHRSHTLLLNCQIISFIAFVPCSRNFIVCIYFPSVKYPQHYLIFVQTSVSCVCQ
jgi:hypothetical protein